MTFGDRALLRQALVHRSYLNEHPETSLESNERLEFLGDALVGLVAAEAFYRRYPDSAEGELTELRASLVRGWSLAAVARRLGLGRYLYLGQGEESSGGRERESNLAGALEAVVGAVMQDQGFTAARKVTLGLLGPELEQVGRSGPPRNAKSQLQELVQRQGLPLPVYRVVEATGAVHAREFTVEVEVGGKVAGQGRGRRKVEAEMRAAEEALGRMDREAE